MAIMFYYALFVQCRPGSDILCIKKQSCDLILRLKGGRGRQQEHLPFREYFRWLLLSKQ